MKFLHYITLGAVALLSVNCSTKPDDVTPSGLQSMNFTAHTESYTTTSQQNAPYQPVWNRNDVISIFSNGNNQRFTLSSTSDEGKTGLFKGNCYSSETYYAIHPYASDNSIADGVISVKLKDTQPTNSIGNIAVAVSESEELNFRNITALISLTVGNENVRSIKLRSTATGESLAGKAEIAFIDTEPAVTITDGTSTVSTSGSISQGNTYRIAVYPGEYSSLELIYEMRTGVSSTLPIDREINLAANTELDLGVITMEEPEPASEWAAVADSCVHVLIENFMNKNKGTFWGSPQNVSNNSGNLYWQQAHAIDVIIYAYERIKGSNESLASSYLSYIRKWYENDANNYNNSKDAEGNYGGFFNAYTDDMCWICLTLLHMSEATGDNLYADTAKDVFDKYIMPRAITDDKGTGLPWTNIADKQGRNSCTNAPGCLTAAKLYRKYGENRHLENAKTLYDYLCNNNLKEDGRVEEPPLSYTQGTFGEACRQLYHITKDSKYMDMAAKVLVYAMTSSRCTNKEILRGEGQDNNQSLFKAVLIPYAVNFVLDSEADYESRETVRTRLLMNGEALRKSLDHSKYPQMYANYYWGETFDTTKVLSMGAQASGASLMENLVRMDMGLRSYK